MSDKSIPPAAVRRLSFVTSAMRIASSTTFDRQAGRDHAADIEILIKSLASRADMLDAKDAACARLRRKNHALRRALRDKNAALHREMAALRAQLDARNKWAGHLSLKLDEKKSITPAEVARFAHSLPPEAGKKFIEGMIAEAFKLMRENGVTVDRARADSAIKVAKDQIATAVDKALDGAAPTTSERWKVTMMSGRVCWLTFGRKVDPEEVDLHINDVICNGEPYNLEPA